MLKRIVNGIFYVGLFGAIGMGLVIAATVLTSGGPVWARVVFALCVATVFILGFKAEGGGSDRNKDEENDAA